SDSEPPERPPVSPITPVASHARLAPMRHSQSEQRIAPPSGSTFMQHPSPVPISESENPDALALRSAISLLQLQREKAKRDMKTLEELKRAAVAEPDGFVRAVQAQRAQASAPADILTPTLSEAIDGNDDTESIGNDDGSRKDSMAASSVPDKLTTKFPSIPQPQNVIRCPPINWAKYHVVGSPLDKLHDQQKKYPGMDPSSSSRGPAHAIAAPYSPFTDGI
ncbi:hypothetical protein GQ43DRAFT_350813, partial [Delitschia confertaspora ATCC 74209]